MPVREQVTEQRSVPEPREVPPLTVLRMLIEDPRKQRDPFWRGYGAEGGWRDRGQHGRLAYEEMYKHPACSAPFNLILAFIKSAHGSFSPRSSDPTERERQMAEFLNDQLERIDWNGLIDGLFGSGLQFGFGIAEWELIIANWQDRPMKQVKDIYVLPQASLDDGDTPREELGEVSTQDPRYHCFDYDDRGRVVRVYQYRNTHLPVKNVHGLPIIWEGPELLNTLIFKHKGGDNNPYGESLFYSAFRPWDDLTLLQQAERIFLQLCSTPFLTAERKSESPSPDFNTELKDMIQQSDVFRLLVGNNVTFGKVSASDRDYAEHMRMVKEELAQEIAQAILVPEATFKTTEQNEQNFRDALMTFIKFRLPEILGEIAGFMTQVFGKRLIDANYSNVSPGQYPKFHFKVNLDTDLKASMQILSQAFPHLDSARMPEAMESLVPGMRREWFAKDHGDSVEIKRPLRDVNDEPNSVTGDSKAKPPDKTGDRGDGRSTENAI